MRAPTGRHSVDMYKACARDRDYSNIQYIGSVLDFLLAGGRNFSYLQCV